MNFLTYKTNMEEIEKKELKVDAGASRSVSSWRIVALLLAALVCVAGLMILMVGLSESEGLWIAGLAVIACSIPLFITSALLRGLATMVEASEYYKAIVKRDFDVKES